VGAELERRKIKENIKCLVCNRDETLLHRFWLCSHSTQVWNILRSCTTMDFALPPGDLRSHGDFQFWILDWFSRLREGELALAMMALYNLWLARSNAREEEMIEHPEKTAARVLALHDEWQALKEVKAPKPTVVTHWSPPVVGWHKANADGAYSSSKGNGGGGVIVRDHHGSPVAGASVFFPVVADPERGELLACRRAVELARDAGVSKLILEMDCAGAVAKLKNSEMDRSIHGPLVEEIKEMLQLFEASSIEHVRRHSNGVAHGLAKRGCRNKVSENWMGCPPGFVMKLLSVDMVV
jgi:ribonuclease HI